ncbi:MAG: PaaI family thioesterase [Candidatus Dormibacteria bacterium]
MTGVDTVNDLLQVVGEPVRGGYIPRELSGLPGIELLRLLLSERIPRPPISYLTGMWLTEVGTGNATFTMPISGWLKTPQGVATGGEVAMLADGPLGCAVHSGLPAGVGYTTIELSVSMLRPVPAAGHLVARGSLVHLGRQLALSEVVVTDDAGRLISHGTSRCLVFPLPDPPQPPGDPGPPHQEQLGDWTPPYQRPALGTVLDDEVWATQSGIEVMDALITGALPPPPIGYLLGCSPVDASEGRCVFEMPATGWLTSPLGTVQGGVTATLAELSLACAVQTTIPNGTAYAPTDLRVQYVRPVPPDGRTLTATGTVVHRGRTFAVARADVVNADGKLVATATGSVLILPGRRHDLRDLPNAD